MQARNPAAIGHLRGHHLLGRPDPCDPLPVQVQKGVARVVPHHVKLWVVNCTLRMGMLMVTIALLFMQSRCRCLELRRGSGDCDAVEVRLEVTLVLGRDWDQGGEWNRPASVVVIYGYFSYLW